MSKKNYVLPMALGTFTISFAPVFVRLATLNPVVVGVYRTLFGALTLLLIALITKDRLWHSWKALGYAALGGLFFAGDLATWQWSIHYIGPGLATILGNFQVFILAIFGGLFFNEKFGARKWLAFPLAFIGLLLLVGMKWHTLTADYRLGILLGLCTAVFYALLVLSLRQTKHLAEPLSPLVNLIMVSLFASAMMAGLTFWQGNDLVIHTTHNLILMICYGVLCQGLAWLLIARSLPHLPISLAGFLILLQPTFAFIWDIVIFRRHTPMLEVIGAAITLFAIYLGSTDTAKEKVIAVEENSEDQTTLGTIKASEA